MSNRLVQPLVALTAGSAVFGIWWPQTLLFSIGAGAALPWAVWSGPYDKRRET